MSDKNKKAEREKGAAPPDYMPAIFGWMSIDDQVEHARELADFTKNFKKEKTNLDNDKYKFSQLKENEIEMIQNLEGEINQSRQDEEKIVLIAFSEKK